MLAYGLKVSMRVSLLLPLVSAVTLAVSPVSFAQVDVRRDGDKLWIQCRASSLEEVLTRITQVAPMELWLEDDVKATPLTASISGSDMQAAFAELMEHAPVNYVLYFNPRHPTQVTKIYVGGGSAKLALQPSVEAPEVEQDPYLADMDIDQLLLDIQGEDAIEALRQALEEQGLDSSSFAPDGNLGEVDLTGLPEELQQLLPTLDLQMPAAAPPKPKNRR